jgi:methyl-accepting chemotaxis protein/methyl-accepting chemotaxis protein-1 (serine sensor receptor)
VSLGSQEQSRGIEQIAKAISQMEQVTQKTAASAEESASAGEELSSHSEHLREEVAELLAIVGGGDGAGAGRPASRAVTGQPAYRGTARPNTAALGALRKAVGGKPPASAHVSVPASDMVAAGVTSFPLDQEEFKEF